MEDAPLPPLPPLHQLNLRVPTPVAGGAEDAACNIEDVRRYGHLLELLREGRRPRDIVDKEDKKEVVNTMEAVKKGCLETWKRLRLYQLQMIKKRNPRGFGAKEQEDLDQLKKELPRANLVDRADEIIRRFNEDLAKFADEEEAREKEQKEKVISRLSSRDYGAPAPGEDVGDWFRPNYAVVDLIYNKPVLSWSGLRQVKDGTELRVQVRKADGTEVKRGVVRDLAPVTGGKYRMKDNDAELEYGARADQSEEMVVLAPVGAGSDLLVMQEDMYVPGGKWLRGGRAGYAVCEA